MRFYSTREAAKKLGIPYTTLATYVTVGKVPGPQTQITGTTAQIWTEEEIEHVRQLLPKIANGRKTRHKKQTALSSAGKHGTGQQSGEAKSKTRSRKKK